MSTLTLARCDEGSRELDELTTIVNRRVQLLIEAVRQSHVATTELLERLHALQPIFERLPEGMRNDTAVLAEHDLVWWYAPLAPFPGFHGNAYVSTTTGFLLCVWRSSPFDTPFHNTYYTFGENKRVDMRGTDPLLLHASLETLFARVVQIIPEVRKPLEMFQQAAAYRRLRLGS